MYCKKNIIFPFFIGGFVEMYRALPSMSHIGLKVKE